MTLSYWRGPLVFVAALASIMSLLAGPPDGPAAITQSLAVQGALRTARDQLQGNKPAAAVETLERQLANANGNPTFLALLREAYAAQLKDLELAGKKETYDLYFKRWQVLEKGARSRPEPKPAVPTRTQPKEVVRGSRPDDDVTAKPSVTEQHAAAEKLTQAERAFADKKYADAGRLFAEIAAHAPLMSPVHRSQWAYCRLTQVVSRLNDSSAVAPATELETEVTSAVQLAPRDGELAKFGDRLLKDIKERGKAASPAAPVRHRDDDNSGWAIAETENFRLFHKQPREFAEQLLRSAEQHRRAASAKWSNPNPAPWQATCEIYLHPTSADYSKATKQSGTSPGHSTLTPKNGKIVNRRMDLRADEPNTLGCVLPHEITHLVIADLFADVPLPRWADEGMAVLAEPQSQIDRCVRTMIRCRQEGKLIPLNQVLGPTEWPEPALITAFYVQSVSVVDYLVNLKGPQEFVQFVRDASRGLDSALQKHYGIRTSADLQDRWLRNTFTEADRAAVKANR